MNVLLISLFDIPIHFPSQYETNFVENYRVLTDFEQKFFYVVQNSIIRFIVFLIFGLSLAVTIGQAFDFTKAFSVEFTFGIAGGFSVGLSLWFSLGLAFGIVEGSIPAY